MTKCISIDDTLPFDLKKTEYSMARGLAPSICYEPWFPRSLESIKECINDGVPVLIRLHSAASYPIMSSDRYTIDLEGHAVLIVGYDDDKQAVELIDPWNKAWGGVLHGKRWLPYSELQIMNVNCTCDKITSLSPLRVMANCDVDSSNKLSLDLKIGFYCPRGTVMDKSSWVITQLSVICCLPNAWEAKDINHVIDGHWYVDDSLRISLPIQNNIIFSGDILLTVKATVQGTRPYQFTDQIEVQKKIPVREQNNTSEIIHTQEAVG